MRKTEIASRAGIALLATASPWLGLFSNATVFRFATLFSFLLFPVGAAIIANSIRSRSRRVVALVAAIIGLMLSVTFAASFGAARDPTFTNDEFSALLLGANLVANLTLAPALAALMVTFGRR